MLNADYSIIMLNASDRKVSLLFLNLGSIIILPRLSMDDTDMDDTDNVKGQLRMHTG